MPQPRPDARRDGIGTVPFGSADDALRPLSHGQLDVWVISHALPATAAATLLSDDERCRAARYRFEKDRRRFCLVRAALRAILSRYSRVPPVEWRFDIECNGRPVIANLCDLRDLRFNVSHADDRSLLAVTRGRSVGVDIEPLDTPGLSHEMAEQFFAPSEVKALRELPEPAWQAEFLERWVLKEACLKACAAGLSIGLDRFGFGLEGRVIEPSFDASLDACAVRWRFATFRPSTRHIAAICVDAALNETEELWLRFDAPGRETVLGIGARRRGSAAAQLQNLVATPMLNSRGRASTSLVPTTESVV